MKAAIQIIREADRGELLTDFQQALDDIVNAIEAERGVGVGEITIKLKIKAKGDAYQVTSDLKVKVPERARLDTTMFFDADAGELTRKDPRQPDLPEVVAADFRNGVNRQQSKE